MNYKDFIRIDIENEIFMSIKKFEETLTLCMKDNYQFKWATIILHNCVQNCMALALKRD